VARIETLKDLDKALTDVAAVLRERAVEVDSHGTFPHKNLKTLQEAGLLGICLPKKFGGLGIGPGGDYRTSLRSTTALDRPAAAPHRCSSSKTRRWRHWD
jgi:alkylation response protein AidB-like acyl-CoA dehydrogenase